MTDFVDWARLLVEGGRGGDGGVSFRKEKFIPKGGPDGGDGGKGGDVLLQANERMGTLLDFKHLRVVRAGKGGNGRGKRMTGRGGRDVLLQVPLGTVVRDAKNGEVIADLIPGSGQVIVAKGGRGGRGNVRFATPSQRAPRQAEKGREGEVKEIILELKLIADVGLVGRPNVGKSTLLRRFSAARPKVGDYPFTTLRPHLGLVRLEQYQSFVMADIPGLVEGAHRGKGLGDRFLRHIERTKVLVFLLEAQSEDLSADLHSLRQELRLFNEELSHKPSLVAVNKLDLVGDRSRFPRCFCCISALTGEGVANLLKRLGRMLKRGEEIEVRH